MYIYECKGMNMNNTKNLDSLINDLEALKKEIESALNQLDN